LALSDVETCAFARVISPLIEKNACIFFTGSKIAPGGYAWVFPRAVGEANVGLGISGNNSEPAKQSCIWNALSNRSFQVQGSVIFIVVEFRLPDTFDLWLKKALFL
jgi:hypothetical protein